MFHFYSVSSEEGRKASTKVSVTDFNRPFVSCPVYNEFSGYVGFFNVQKIKKMSA